MISPLATPVRLETDSEDGISAERRKKNVRAGGVGQVASTADRDDVGGLCDGSTGGEESSSDSGETHLERDGEQAVQRVDKRSSEGGEDEVTDSRTV